MPEPLIIAMHLKLLFHGSNYRQSSNAKRNNQRLLIEYCNLETKYLFRKHLFDLLNCKCKYF